MKLIFERGYEGQALSLMPKCDVPEYTLAHQLRRDSSQQWQMVCSLVTRFHHLR